MPSERAPDGLAASAFRPPSAPTSGAGVPPPLPASLEVIRADDLLTQVAIAGSLDLTGV